MGRESKMTVRLEEMNADEFQQYQNFAIKNFANETN